MNISQYGRANFKKLLLPLLVDQYKGSIWVQIIYARLHVTYIYSLYRHVTFYKTLTSLSTVYIKPHVELLQLLKWPYHTFFSDVEP